MNLEENLPREGELSEEEHTSTHKGDRYKRKECLLCLWHQKTVGLEASAIKELFYTTKGGGGGGVQHMTER